MSDNRKHRHEVDEILARAAKELDIHLSPDLDAYASGQLEAHQIRCVLCGHAPCDCPPFGSPEYFALVDKLHERRR